MISSERFNGIRSFVEAADTGSFTRAATRLGLSKSAVGKGIARLEERLGVRLFNRTTRSLSLTDEGRAFYESCLRAIAELEQAEARLSAAARTPAGRLRVDLPVLFGRRWVMPVLLDLARQHPGLDLDISFSNRMTDLVEDGVDLVLRIGTPAPSASLIARALGTQKAVVCATPAYLAARGHPRTPDDLRGHDCILDHRDAHHWRFTGGPVAITGRHRFDSADAAHAAACAGLGIAYLPRWIAAADLASGALVTVLEDHMGPGLPIHALWPRTRQLAPRVRVLVDALAARFLPRPPWDDPTA